MSHYWCGVEIRLKPGTVKLGTSLFARASVKGEYVRQSWGATKPCTRAKEEGAIVFPSLLHGTYTSAPALCVSVHIDRLAGNPSVENWVVGKADFQSVKAGLNECNIKNNKGEVIGRVDLIAFIVPSYDASPDDYVYFEAMATKLDRMDGGLMGKSDPYFVIYKTVGDRRITLYKSQYQKKSLNPNWGSVVIAKALLGGDNDKEELWCEVWDWDKDSEMGGDDKIGAFKFTLADLLGGKTHFAAVINEDKKEKKSGYTDSGSFMFTDGRVVTQKTEIYDLTSDDKLRIKLNFVGLLGPTDDAKSKMLEEMDDVMEKIWDYTKDLLSPDTKDGRLWGIDAYGQLIRLPDAKAEFGEFNCHPFVGPQFKTSNTSSHAPTNKIGTAITFATSAAMDDRKAVAGAYNIFFFFVTDDIKLADLWEPLVNSASWPVSYVFIGIGDAAKTNWKNLEQLNPSSFGFEGNERWAPRNNVRFLPYSASGYEYGPIVAASNILSEMVEFTLIETLKAAGVKTHFKPLYK